MREILSALKPKDKVTIAASMSALALVLMSIVLLFSFCSANNHEHEYDYRLELEDGKFNLVGHCEVPGCADPEYVEENVSGVKLVSAVRPTCINEGKREYVYEKNGLRLQYTEILGTCAHIYNPNDLKVQDGSITASCAQEGCDNTLTLADVESIVIDQHIAGDCFMPTQTVYKYTANGRESKFITLQVVAEAHTLGGKPATSFANADGTYNYGVDGIKWLSTNGNVDCGTAGDGYYVCEKCSQMVAVKVKRQHKIAFSTTGMVEPTTTATGSVKLACSNAGCQYSEQVVLPAVVIGGNSVVISPDGQTPIQVRYTYTHSSGLTLELELSVAPVEHNFVYELRIIEFGGSDNKKGRLDLVGKCVDPNCTATDTIENVDFKMNDTSTCTKGEFTFRCEMDGNVYELKMPFEGTSDNHVFGYNLAQATKPSPNSEGSITIYCKSGCAYSKTVVLPKVEIGVNAEVVLDEEPGTTVRYTYTAPNGCVIDMFIVIDK